jgi:hypothetical protein
MTLRDRILAVYRGLTPDVTPFMLDLSHWFYHKHRMPWDLSAAYEEPEYALIDYHKKAGVGFYVPNLGAFYSTKYADDVTVEVEKDYPNGTARITWRYKTPLGTIERKRRWEEDSYSWAIEDWGVHTEQELRVLSFGLSRRSYSLRRDRYQAWVDYVGDTGVVYILSGYSAMGEMLNYWMGVQETMYAVTDLNSALHEVVDEINDNNLKLIDLLATSRAEVVLMGDNFSSDIQPPHFFAEWSKAYYMEAIRRLHKAGKSVGVHIDGKLRGAIKMFAEIGVDCVDAVTPKPMGDLDPDECRLEAGPRCILSGGVSPGLWLSNVKEDDFKRAVISWLELKESSPRFIANAGDQVPPWAMEGRIEMMRELVERYGRY